MTQLQELMQQSLKILVGMPSFTPPFQSLIDFNVIVSCYKEFVQICKVKIVLNLMLFFLIFLVCVFKNFPN